MSRVDEDAPVHGAARPVPGGLHPDGDAAISRAMHCLAHIAGVAGDHDGIWAMPDRQVEARVGRVKPRALGVVHIAFDSFTQKRCQR